MSGDFRGVIIFWLINRLHQTHFCGRVDNTILRPLFCAPSPAAPGGDCPPLPPPSLRHCVQVDRRPTASDQRLVARSFNA